MEAEPALATNSISSDFDSENLPKILRRHPSYEVLGVLGKGGMGVVYLARPRLLRERRVAIKIVQASLLTERDDHQARFQKEIETLGSLNHPNIVAVQHAELTDEGLLLVMECLRGCNLAALVGVQGPMAPSRAAWCVSQAAAGLQYAWERNLVHRDIKPQNLFLCDQEETPVVKLIDFGLAKAVRADGKGDFSLTGPNQVLCTPAYLAPERVQQVGSTDIRSDIFSLGGTLHFLLTGEPPFPGDDLYSVIQSQVQNRRSPVHMLRCDVPLELSRIVDKMLADDPRDRFQQPREVVEALAPFIGDQAESAAHRAPVTTNRSPKNADSERDTESAGKAATQHTGLQEPAPIQPTQSLKSPLKRKLLIALAFLALSVLFAGILYVVTDDGFVEIRTEDDSVKVVVEQQGRLIRIIDPKSRQTWRLNTGTYTIRLEGNPDGLEIEPPKDRPFTLKRGGTAIVTVKRKPIVDHESSADFVPLFNGKTLKGWQTYRGTTNGWRVENGLMIGTASNEMLYYTADEFADFRLRVKCKVAAGCMLHVVARSDMSPAWPANSYRLNIGFDRTDPLKTGSIHTWLPITKDSHRPDEWVTTETVFQGPKIQSFVNGREVGQQSHDWFRKGRIALRVATPGTVTIEKIELKHMPPVEPPRKKITDHFVSLLEGDQLRSGDDKFLGWEKTAEGWVSKGNTSVLISKLGDYSDFTLRAEVWLAPETLKMLGVRASRIPNFHPSVTYYGIVLCAEKKDDPERTGAMPGYVSIKSPLHKANEWVPLEVTCRGKRITVVVNGEKAVDIVNQQFTSGHVIVTSPTAGLFKIRKLEIKEHDSPPPPTILPRKQVLGNQWRIENNELVQGDKAAPLAACLFGETTWRDYDFSFEFRAEAGKPITGAYVRAQGADTTYLWVLGADKNQKTIIDTAVKYKLVGRPGAANHSIVPERWYKAMIRVRGDKLWAYLDDETVLTNLAIPRHRDGMVGLFTRETSARFRNVLVAAPDGKVLWDGLPGVE